MVRENLGLGMRTRGVIGSRIARPGWLDYSKVAFSLANGGASTSEPAVRAAAVEEEEDEDDEGPVELTGAYKTMQLDIKHLKERLRYYSKKWEIRNIAICEEDRIATELRKAGSSVIEKQKQSVTLNCLMKQFQKEEPGSNGSQSAIVEREASQYAFKTHESSSSSVIVVSVISTSLLQEAEVKINS